MSPDLQKELRNIKPKHDFFMGIDSDGSVFDTTYKPSFINFVLT